MIVHFSEKIKEIASSSPDRFAGHFGGDDFFSEAHHIDDEHCPILSTVNENLIGILTNTNINRLNVLAEKTRG